MDDAGASRDPERGQEPPSEAYRRGLELRNRVLGEAGAVRRRMLRAVHPDLESLLIERAWGAMAARDAFDDRTRELLTLAILLALGRDREAATHLHGALNVGVTRDELVELLYHCSIYAGFPAAMTGAHLLADVLQARGELPAVDAPPG